MTELKRLQPGCDTQSIIDLLQSDGGLIIENYASPETIAGV